MTKFAYTVSVAAMTLTALFAASQPAFAGEANISAAAPSVAVGTMLYAAGGKRLATVYRVKADGSPQIILDGKLVTVPASTILSDNGKLATSLTKTEIKTR